jgi:glycosyltransferase involved in cell wall biosynthesis
VVLGTRLDPTRRSAPGLTLRIVVDVTPLSLPRTGIGNYLRGMLTGLTNVIGVDDELVAFGLTGLRGRSQIERSLARIPLEQRLVSLPLARVWRPLWSRAGSLPVERLVRRLDVFHFSDWMYPAQASGVRATTIHDLVPLRFPQWTDRTTRRLHVPKYRNAALTCDLVFVNSQFTAADVGETLQVSDERLRVAYPGIDPAFRPDGPGADHDAPYLLAVSTLEPRKNLGRLVEAFELVRRKHPELELVIAGAGEAPPALRRPGVRFLGYVPEGELPALYRSASAFAYPSLFEGFGIPIVEALASGVPTVASAHRSLDEASGKAAYRADPDDPEALAEAVEQALETDKGRRSAGLEHAARFSWRACAEAVLDSYRSAL